MGKSSTKTTTNAYDPVASEKMSEIAERQQQMAEEQWGMYKDFFQDYEIEAVKANQALLPYVSEAAQKTLQEQITDLGANADLKTQQRITELAQLNEALEDIEANKPLKNALRAEQLALSQESLADIAKNRPLKDQIRKEQMALSKEAEYDVVANRPLKDKSREELMAYMDESLADIEANRPIKEAIRSNQMKELGVSAGEIDRITGEIKRAAPIAEKFYNEAETGVDVNRRMDEAKAEVINATKLGEQMRRREASRYGINPNSTAFGKALTADSLETAKGIAGARTAARNQAEAENFGRLQTALGVRESNQSALRSNMTSVSGPSNLITTTGGNERIGLSLPGVGQGVNITSPGGGGVALNTATQPLQGVSSQQGLNLTSIGSADPYSRATTSFSGAASSYQPLATRVLSSTSKESGGGFGDVFGKLIGTAGGSVLGGWGSAFGASLVT